MTLDGVDGVAFVVLAPNAKAVSVVGDFNFWNALRHPMRVRGVGYWELFVPHARAGDRYKFDVTGPDGRHLPLKSDPVAFAAEIRPSTASIVVDESRIPHPRPAPAGINALGAPISIYEVHLGSWRRKNGNEWLSYRDLAEQLPAYAKDMGFTHIEFLPVSEHPFDGSWGYQPTGLYAPTSRFGTPEDFSALVDACHREGIGVWLDWVPGHFPDDPHGLGYFDGTALYEHANPLQGRHLDWGTLIYNYGRTEVVNFLVSNALFWFDRYGVDGLRVDAVASMLYLDYSRPAGEESIPNRHGGRENLEAIEFLRRFNIELFGHFPEATTAAEECPPHGRRSRSRSIWRARLRLQMEHGLDARHAEGLAVTQALAEDRAPKLGAVVEADRVRLAGSDRGPARRHVGTAVLRVPGTGALGALAQVALERGSAGHRSRRRSSRSRTSAASWAARGESSRARLTPAPEGRELAALDEELEEVRVGLEAHVLDAPAPAPRDRRAATARAGRSRRRGAPRCPPSRSVRGAGRARGRCGRRRPRRGGGRSRPRGRGDRSARGGCRRSRRAPGSRRRSRPWPGPARSRRLRSG